MSKLKQSLLHNTKSYYLYVYGNEPLADILLFRCLSLFFERSVPAKVCNMFILTPRLVEQFPYEINNVE